MNILPFDATGVNLANAGGKGANLARLTKAKFNVPPGFIVSTSAYRAFVSHNTLQIIIQPAIEAVSTDDVQQLEQTSAQIRAAFKAGAMPQALRNELLAAYAPFHATPVAVRSSATAEDLPELSFAGQQDTYLNVIGDEQLLEAVIGCWGSLWTARAIGYRIRNGIAHDEVALAVVVQKMVMSEVSGVLFTANPLNGQRRETVIDATIGLGEALVSGQVEPDHFVANSLNGSVISRTIGSKAVATRSKPEGGIETVSELRQSDKTLSDDDVKQLVDLGQRVQAEYGTAQDIEWAFADKSDKRLYLLQARPITSLFPVPEIIFDPLKVWFSFGAVQGLLAPITPLGRTLLQYIIANASTLFGIAPNYNNSVMQVAGERLWMHIGGVIRHPLGKKLYERLIGMVEPSTGAILKSLANEPGIRIGQGKVKLSTMHRVAHFMLPIFKQTIYNIRQPELARQQVDEIIANVLTAAHVAPDPVPNRYLANCVSFMKSQFSRVFQLILPKFVPMLMPSIIGLNILGRFANDKNESEHGVANTVLEILRGLPRNVTTEMDLALWDTAKQIINDAAALQHFQSCSAQALASDYLAGRLPNISQNAVAGFMHRYGMRGVGEFDFGQARWREAPEPVMHTLQSYLQITPEFAPDMLFAKGEKAAEQAIQTLADHASQQHGGKIKAKMVRGLARRVRMWLGTRESPKFFIIQLMGIARQALLQVGQAYVNEGILHRPDDLFFLSLAELEKLSAMPTPLTSKLEWQSLISDRRASHAREARRNQVPRVLVSDGRAFYEGLGNTTDQNDIITGSPVSPGVVEGVVHVVFDPRVTQLAPGEILVCPGTDPAWTPLFMTAGGLVTEVGGMMTHGSVVAREYGIPAVVGVHMATTRLKNGQRIRLDGASGKIVLLEGAPA